MCLTLKRRDRAFSFIQVHSSLTKVLTDRKLTSLGDAFINLASSLALSNRKGAPSGTKVKGTLLAEALRKAGLREYARSKMTTHMLAEATEAFIMYAWLLDYVSLEEAVAILEKNDDPVEGLCQLLERIKSIIKFS
jgi:hypothetical protein